MNEAILQELLGCLSTAFSTRDIPGLLRLFSGTAGATYAGSEPAEKATGPDELRALFSDLLARPGTYSFEFRDVTFGEQSGLVWVLADGDGTETGGDGATDAFGYRVSGVLVQEEGRWCWLLLAGSEPAAPIR